MLCFSGGSTPFTGVSCRHAQILLKIFPFVAKANFWNIDLWTIQFATHCDFPSLDTTGRLFKIIYWAHTGAYRHHLLYYTQVMILPGVPQVGCRRMLFIRGPTVVKVRQNAKYVFCLTKDNAEIEPKVTAAL